MTRGRPRKNGPPETPDEQQLSTATLLRDTLTDCTAVCIRLRRHPHASPLDRAVADAVLRRLLRIPIA